MSSEITRYIQHKNDIEPEWLKRISPQINRAGWGYDREGYIDPQRIIYDHELQLFGPGGVYDIDIEGTVLTAEENSFVIIPPGMWHILRGISCSRTRRSWLHFDWEFVPQPRKTPFFTYAPGKPVREAMKKPPHYIPEGILAGTLHEPGPVFDIHERICERFEKGTVQEMLSARGLVIELFAALFSGNGTVFPEACTVQPGRIRMLLLRLAEEPFDAAPSVRAELERLGQSYDHLSRVFRKSYGVTPLQFVNSIRMERAKNLLKDTGMNVGEVADRLGFRNQAYFSRLFRKLTGNRPSEVH